VNLLNAIKRYFELIKALDAFVKLSGGDLRQAITLLQSAKRLNGSEPVTQETVWEMTGVDHLLILDHPS
jgi:DNA polymerase III delta prime subunit